MSLGLRPHQRESSSILSFPSEGSTSSADADAASPYLTPTWQRCRLRSCFDYSRCPLQAGFPVYVYDTAERLAGVGNGSGYDSRTGSKNFGINMVGAYLTKAFQASAYAVSDPSAACLYVLVSGERAALA